MCLNELQKGKRQQRLSNNCVDHRYAPEEEGACIWAKCVASIAPLAHHLPTKSLQAIARWLPGGWLRECGQSVVPSMSHNEKTYIESTTYLIVGKLIGKSCDLICPATQIALMKMINAATCIMQLRFHWTQRWVTHSTGNHLPFATLWDSISSDRQKTSRYPCDQIVRISATKKKRYLEVRGFDPRTSRMLSGRSTN